MSLIVSLSSIPPRFDKLEPVLQGLLAQKAKVDEIRLYIPKTYRRFPDYDGTLPRVPHGIRIIQPEEDLGPASKVLFAADDLRGTDCNIIYCDDDRVYHKHWFSRMLAAQAGHEDRCIATMVMQLSRIGISVEDRRFPRVKRTKTNARRVRQLLTRKIKQVTTGVTVKKPPRSPRFSKAGFGDIAEGFGAVLVKPEFFDAEDYNIPSVLWSVDDIWLSGQLERKGIPIWCTKGFDLPSLSAASAESALLQAVIDGAGRNDANLACVRYMQDTYGIWR